MKKQKTKGSFYQNLKLRQKMSMIIGSMTFFILLALLYFLLSSFSHAMNKRVDANMSNKALEASSDLEELMHKLDTIAINIEESISFVHGQNDVVGGIPGNPWTLEDLSGNAYTVPAMENITFKSRLVDSYFPASRYNAEVVILNTIYSYMKSESQLEDIGVFFEPDAFYRGVYNYAPLLMRKNVEGRKLVNFPYANYKDKAYYKGAKEKGDTYISPVYTDDTTKERMFALSRPMFQDGKFLGVILIDVNEELLNNVSQQDEDFPSMFVNLIDGEGLIHTVWWRKLTERA